jgi:hypothetical protein
MSEHDLEAPEDDVTEQQTPASETDLDEEAVVTGSHDSDEVDPADRAEQEQPVVLDDDDEYR